MYDYPVNTKRENIILALSERFPSYQSGHDSVQIVTPLLTTEQLSDIANSYSLQLYNIEQEGSVLFVTLKFTPAIVNCDDDDEEIVYPDINTGMDMYNALKEFEL